MIFGAQVFGFGIYNYMKILCDVPMGTKTTFGCGGNARWFCQVADFAEFETLLRLHKGKKLFVLGAGSKTLCADDGFDGLVICTTSLQGINKQDELVVCDAGVSFDALRQYCEQNGLSGLEWSAGIPASVGGAVVMNAGAFGHEFCECVEKVEVFADGKRQILQKEQIQFAYRHSSLKDKVVFRVFLRLVPANSASVRQKYERHHQTKLARQPVGVGSAGSVFKRSDDVIPAKIIDKLGLKGVKIGQAEISKLHSGFIVNMGGATATDVLALVDLVQKKVQTAIGYILEKEIVVME